MEFIAQSTIDRLQQIISADLDSVKENAIFPIENGYCVFDKYHIKKHPVGVTVESANPKIYTEEKYFSCTKNAVSWCVADKYNQTKLAEEIILLDKKRYRLHGDIEFSKRLIKKFSDPMVRETALTKLYAKQDVLRGVENSLEKCANLAKYWQLRGFNNEIERTRRSASNSNSRSNHRVTFR